MQRLEKHLDKILLVPEKTDSERDQVVQTWQQSGGKILRLGKFWEKPADWQNGKIAIYGNDTFALVAAQVFGVRLISPAESLLTSLHPDWTKRRIWTQTVEEVKETDFPVFCKPLVPKQFKAQVYQSLNQLLTEAQGLPPQTQLLLSDEVSITAEARGFVLHNQLQDLALYEGEAPLNEGETFLTHFIQNQADMPKTYVADIGYHSSKGWFIIEFNACWGAGLNHCHPAKVLECILEATENDYLNK